MDPPKDARPLEVLPYATPVPALKRPRHKLFGARVFSVLGVVSGFVAWAMCASARDGIVDAERVIAPLMIVVTVAVIAATVFRVGKHCRQRIQLVDELGTVFMVAGATLFVAMAIHDLLQAW